MSAAPNIQALKRVREQRGFDIPEVAAFAAISADRLGAFERGERTPSRRQMERLADAYGVPLYSLFGEAIPVLSALPRDYRKILPGRAEISPRGMKPLLAAERISEYAKQLSDEVGFKPAKIARSSQRPNSPAKQAELLRKSFDAWFAPREKSLAFSGSPEGKFMSALRLFFEVQGGIVNVNTAPSNDYMGFFISPDDGFPTIFVNRAISSRKAQLFTFAHELAHSLEGQDGISNPFLARNNIERRCNVFAAEFIAPIDEFRKVVEGLGKTQRSETIDFVNLVAGKTLLSRHAAAIRLLEADFITQAQLNVVAKLFNRSPREEKDDEKADATEGPKGVPHAKRIGELGYLPTYLSKIAVAERVIDSFDVEQSLGLSLGLQQRAFDLAARRLEIASS